MKKLLFLFAITFWGCITIDKVEESICVDRCILIEGTILNSVTKESLQNVTVEGSYFRPSFTISGRDIKAKTVTDINGFYSMRFEVFDTEIGGGGNFEVQINNCDDDVFWPYGEIDLLKIYDEDFNFDNVYIADFWIPTSATVKYDMDCLSHLKESETATFNVSYTFEGIDGPINAGKKLVFNSDTEKDDGSIKVPAGVPLTIVAATITQAGTSEIENLVTTLIEDEVIKVEVRI